MPRVRSAAVLLSAEIAVAAEKPPAEAAAAPPAQDGLAAAHRDREAVTATRGLTGPPQAAVPSLLAPGLPSAPPGSPRAEIPRAKPGAGAAKQSADWLVDAMTPKSARPGIDKGRGTGKTANATSGAAADESAAVERRVAAEPAERQLSGEPAERRESRENLAPVVNPLARFMAGWMTPHDFTLLQGGADAAPAGRSGGGERSDGPPASGPGPAANFSDAFGRGRPDRTAVAPRENPFLRDLAPGPAAAVAHRGGAVPAPPAANAPPPQSAAPPAAPPTSPSALPAFVKPTTRPSISSRSNVFRAWISGGRAIVS